MKNLKDNRHLMLWSGLRVWNRFGAKEKNYQMPWSSY